MTKLFIKDSFQDGQTVKLTYSVDENPNEYSISAPAAPNAQDFLATVFPRIKARHKGDSPLIRELLEISKSGEPIDDGEGEPLAPPVVE